MKTKRPSNAPVTITRKTLSLVAAAAAVLAGHDSQAASINFGPATTIAGDSDVFNLGSLNYALDWANSTQTVNGVTFTGTNSATPAGGNVTLAGIGSNSTTAFNSGTAPFSTLSAAYKAMLIGAEFNGGAAGTVTLGNLVTGHVYATQYWANDPRPIAGRLVVVSSTGGNSVVLNYSTANIAGSPGQYTVGGFTADATTQVINLASSGGSTQINAIQVRDVTGVWSGATNGTWDGGSVNFTGGQIFATVSGLVNAVGFADTDGFKNAVTNNNITIAAGGVSIGTVNLQNNALAYTFNSASATGMTGATVLNKTGTGTVNLAGANTFTGNTSVTAGSLVLKHTAALQNSTLTTGNVTFDSSVGSNAFTLGGLSGSGNLSLLNNAATPVTLSVGNNNASTAYSAC
jgi:autotransporter-associated beta strand protein